MREREHLYGPHVHLLDSVYADTLLAKFCSPECPSADLFPLLRKLFTILTEAACDVVMPREMRRVQTRMIKYHREAEFSAELLAKNSPVVVVDMMRAGILPAQICYELFLDVFQPAGVRQDHVLLNRATNASGEVTGVNIQGHKMGGRADEATVFFPDPMGATGSSLKGVIELYKELTGARRFVALHLIVTPEYLKALSGYGSELSIFALRLDRGLSAEKILDSKLGEFWDGEKGLNDHQYIVPGAGGVGEILNNADV